MAFSLLSHVSEILFVIHVLPRFLIFITKYSANAPTFQLTRVRFHLKTFENRGFFFTRSLRL